MMPDRIPVSTYVKASETDGYVALLRNVNVLKKMDSEAAQTPAPVCGMVGAG